MPASSHLLRVFSAFFVLWLVVIGGSGAFAHAADVSTQLPGMDARIALDTPRNRLYATVPDRNQVLVLDATTLATAGTIALAERPAGIDLSSDGRRLFVAMEGTGRVAIIALPSRAVSYVSVREATSAVQLLDVVEAWPGRLVVTARERAPSPNFDGPFAAVVNLDDNNRVSRLEADEFGTWIGGVPSLAADRRTGRAFIMEGHQPSNALVFDVRGGATRAIERTEFGIGGRTLSQPWVYSDAIGGLVSRGGTVILPNPLRVVGRLRSERDEPVDTLAVDNQAQRIYQMRLSEPDEVVFNTEAVRIEVSVFDAASRLEIGGVRPQCPLHKFDFVEEFSRQRQLLAAPGGALVYLVYGDTLCRASTAIDQPVPRPAGLYGAPHAMAVDGRRGLVHVSVPERHEIVTLDLAHLGVVRRTLVGADPRRVELSDDGRLLYVAVTGAGQVAVVDLDTYAVSYLEVTGSTDGIVLLGPPLPTGELLVFAGSRLTGGGTLRMRARGGQSPIQVDTLLANHLDFVVDRERGLAHATSGGKFVRYELGRPDLPRTYISPIDASRRAGDLGRIVLSPDGRRVVTEVGLVFRAGGIDSRDYREEGSVTGGVHAFSDGGKVLSVAAPTAAGGERLSDVEVKRFDALTLAPLASFRTCRMNEVREMAALPGSSNMLVLGDERLCKAGPASDASAHPDYFPLRPGSELRYEADAGTRVVERIERTTRAFADGPARGVETDGRFVSYYRIDDEQRQITWHGLFDPVQLEDEPGTYLFGEFSDPIVLSDSDVYAGKARNHVGRVRYDTGRLGAFSLDVEARTQVMSREVLTVPAGTFNTFRLEVSLRQFDLATLPPIDQRTSFTLWLAPGIGPVQQRSNGGPLVKLVDLTGFPDSDGDQVATVIDNCPSRPNRLQTNSDGDREGDACDADDDNDAISDVDERRYGLDPLDASDAGEDADGDGLSNLQEVQRRRNPLVNEAVVVVPLLQMLD